METTPPFEREYCDINPIILLCYAQKESQPTFCYFTFTNDKRREINTCKV